MNLLIEKKLTTQGYKLVAGADEAGRGALAGPIVAAVVILSKDLLANPPDWLSWVKDSKILNPQKRQEIFKLARRQIIWSIGLVNSRQIDSKGITWSNHQVVFKAVNKLKVKPDYLLTDYIAKLPKKIKNLPVQSLVDGDAKVLSIALASVMAKVYRDKVMDNYDKKYPNYNFSKNKGYGTKDHLKKLRLLGPCSIHRLTYRPVKDSLV
ncbi:ribonuclease HII [Patescibacteria group bacterium]|nr:ribonuclease HII [Patescibacteria group bacterium]